jgi:tetratricopeptide (TPR) repeat protein
MARVTSLTLGIIAALAAAVLCAVTPVLAQPVQGQRELAAPARWAVNQVLYASTPTSAAAERALDERINEQRRAIEALRRRLNEGGARNEALAAELSAAQERYVAELCQLERSYAEEIAVLRGAAEDIASTSEGIAALERFNAGDELGALLALDRLRDARARARQVRNTLESAAEARNIAVLAMETRDRGRLDTNAVIARYEEITRLDPGESHDWRDLGALYLETGRVSETIAAAERAEQTASSNWERGKISELRTDTALRMGDLEAAARYADASVSISREIIASGEARSGRGEGASGTGGYGDTLNTEDAALLNLSIDLDRVAGIARRRGDFGRALAVFDESRSIRAALSARNPALFLVETHAGVLFNLGAVHLERGELELALTRHEQAIALIRPLLERTQAARVHSNLAGMLESSAYVLLARNEIERARPRAAEALATRRRLLATDPSNTAFRDALASSLTVSGSVALRDGALDGAIAQFAEAAAAARNGASIESRPSTSHGTLVRALLGWGAALSGQGNAPGALIHLREAADVANRLATANPGNSTLAAQVAYAHEQLGDALHTVQAYTEANEKYETALEIRLTAAGADTDPDWYPVAWNHFRIAYNWENMNGEIARAKYLEGYALARRIAAAQPGNVNMRRTEALLAYHAARWDTAIWPQAGALWDAMQRDGLATDADQPIIDHIRTNIAP